MTAVLLLGEQAAQAIRDLNHRTREADAFTGPAQLSCLLAELNATAQRIPQLLNQLSRWLAEQQADARLIADDRLCTSQVTAAATSALTDATHHAHRLAAALDAAHQQVAQLATA